MFIVVADPLAQAVEHLTFNQGVPGSIPGWVTKFTVIERLDSLFSSVVDARMILFGVPFLYAPVAQLDRAIASDAMCRAFESHRAYHSKTPAKRLYKPL